MNSVVMDFGGNAGSGIARWLDALKLSADRNLRRLIGSVYALMLLAMAILCLGKGRIVVEALLALFMLPTFFAWAFWFSRALLLQMAAREARIPSLQRDALRGLLLAGVITVLLPSLVLSLAGSDPVLTFAALTATALVGLLFALLPRGFAAFLGFGPMLFNRLHITAWLQTLAWYFWLPAAIALLFALVAWRWRVVLAMGPDANTASWRQPMVFFQGQTGAFGAWRQMGEQQQFARFGWLRKYAVDAGPATPVRAMRTWLGGSFAPLRWSSRLAEGVLIIVLLLLFPWLLASNDDMPMHGRGLWFAGMVWSGMFALMMLAMMFAPRLMALRRRPNGELAELALLPGWGGPAQARATLLRAVARPMATVAVLAAILLAVSGWLAGIGVSGDGLLALAWSGGLLMGVVACLQPLSGRELGWQWGLALVVLGVPMLSGTVMFAAWNAHHPLGATAMLAMMGAWALLDAILLLLAARSWRRMHAMPQPFLQQ